MNNPYVRELTRALELRASHAELLATLREHVELVGTLMRVFVPEADDAFDAANDQQTIALAAIAKAEGE